MIPTD